MRFPWSKKAAPGSATTSPVLGGTGEPAATYIIADTVAGQVRADVERAGYAAPSASHVDALRERAAAQVGAAAPPAIDGKASVADLAALERLDLLKKDVETAHVELESCRGEARRAEDALNDLDRPWSFVVRFLVVAGTIVGTAVCVFAVGKLMAPSFDAYFVRSWAESLNLGDAAAGYSVREAKWISFSVAAGTMFLSTLGTLALRRARWWLKVLPLLAEALLSISFATIRLSHRLTFSAMAVSGLEMSVVLGQLAGLLLVAAALDHDSIKREPFTKALCKLTALMARVDVAREGHAEAERKLAEQVTALQRREDAVRALPAVKELVDATVAAEYVTAISNLVEHKAATRDEEATSIDPSAIPKTNGASANGVDHGEE